ncbi:DNA primase, partial [Rhizobium ruizarguesonis]
GAYTGRAVTGADGGTTVEPDAAGNIFVFPFIDGGLPVGEKYRAPGKKFWQRRGGRKTFWNADCMDYPALEEGHKALIITEGEIAVSPSIS